MRCATVTENVLKIRKPPTISATPANTSSAVREAERVGEVLRLLRGRLPVRTLKSRPLRWSAALTLSPGATGIES